MSYSLFPANKNGRSKGKGTSCDVWSAMEYNISLVIRINPHFLMLQSFRFMSRFLNLKLKCCNSFINFMNLCAIKMSFVCVFLSTTFCILSSWNMTVNDKSKMVHLREKCLLLHFSLSNEQTAVLCFTSRYHSVGTNFRDVTKVVQYGLHIWDPFDYWNTYWRDPYCSTPVETRLTSTCFCPTKNVLLQQVCS